MLCILTLLCMPNLASGATFGIYAPHEWIKDSSSAAGLPFPKDTIMESTCQTIVGYLRNLWDVGADFDPLGVHGEMVRSLFLAISDLRVIGKDRLQP